MAEDQGRLTISDETIRQLETIANEYPDGIHTCAQLQEMEPGRRPCTCGRCPRFNQDQLNALWEREMKEWTDWLMHRNAIRNERKASWPSSH